MVLGRDKKACLADETTAQDTLKQNWSKYVASDKSDCVGMVRTGGPASYVELLSCGSYFSVAGCGFRSAPAPPSPER
jgi:hypothetical protein